MLKFNCSDIRRKKKITTCWKGIGCPNPIGARSEQKFSYLVHVNKWGTVAKSTDRFNTLILHVSLQASQSIHATWPSNVESVFNGSTNIGTRFFINGKKTTWSNESQFLLNKMVSIMCVHQYPWEMIARGYIMTYSNPLKQYSVGKHQVLSSMRKILGHISSTSTSLKTRYITS